MTNNANNYGTYDLEVVTSRTPGDFVHALFERIGVEAHVEEIEGIWDITTQNFRITAFDGAHDALSGDLGIIPTVFIEFRPKPTLETDILALKNLITALDKWLHYIQNDCALIHNGEAVMLYRKDGKLYVNDACRAWTPARLSLVTYPYDTVTMPALKDISRHDS